jgi:hypothetical protein
MVRTQIQLPEAQYWRLRAIAEQRHVSLSKLIRQLLDHGLHSEGADRAALYEHAGRLVGAFRAKEDDLSTGHDRHLEKRHE